MANQGQEVSAGTPAAQARPVIGGGPSRERGPPRRGASALLRGGITRRRSRANRNFALDPWRVIPPRNNALAPRRGDPRPLDSPPPLTGPAGAASVSALDCCS